MALAGLVVLGCTALAAFRTDLWPRLGPRVAFALGALTLLGLLFAAIRAFVRRRDPQLIEPSFETSILAFPPEPKLGPRPLSRT